MPYLYKRYVIEFDRYICVYKLNSMFITSSMLALNIKGVGHSHLLQSGHSKNRYQWKWILTFLFLQKLNISLFYLISLN